MKTNPMTITTRSIRCAGIALAVMVGVGVPSRPVSADPERLVHRYLETRISPDAREVAAVEGDPAVGAWSPHVRDLVMRPANGGHAARVELPCGRVPQCWPGSLAWSPDSARLAFTLRTPGSHRYSIYTVSPDGAALRKLLDFEGTLTDLRYSRQGTLAVLAVSAATKEVGAVEAGAPLAGDLDAPPPEQRIAVVSEGALRWVSPPDLFVYEYDWRPDGRGFVATAAPGDGDRNWWKARLQALSLDDSATRVIYAPQSGQQQIASPRISPQGNTVAFIVGLMSDFGSTGGDVYTLTLGTGSTRNVTPDLHASVTDVFWSCDGKLIAQVLAGDATQFVDLGTGQTAGEPRVLWNGQESIDVGGTNDATACPAGVQAVSHESFTAPPELAVGKIGQWRNLTGVNAGLTSSARVVSVKWKNEGYNEQGWLLVPPVPATKMPLVTIVHGGPAAASVPSFFGPGLVPRMLDQGWSVFLPNPRGSFGQGERFVAANVRDFGYGDLRDLLAGIDAVERVAPIDEQRLALLGHSYGGFMTMWAITQTTRFKVAVAGAGISNWQSYYGQNGIDEWMIPYFGASVYDDPYIYGRSSAMNFIRNVRTPTFVYVGENDVECPAPQTEEFWHALKALGVPVSIMIYPGEGHAIHEPAHREDLMKRTLEWLRKYLQ